MVSARDMQFSGEFSEVVEFYNELRYILYKRVNKKFSQFQATPINYNDCVIADSWINVDSRGRGDWYWTKEYHGYIRLFKRFDIAFKQGGKLVSLSYGVPTAAKTGLKINLIESTPFKQDKLGIKAFELLSYAAQVYAAMLGADEIRIMQPTSPGNRAYYCSFGYEYVSNSHKSSLPDYCVMKLR